MRVLMSAAAVCGMVLLAPAALAEGLAVRGPAGERSYSAADLRAMPREAWIWEMKGETRGCEGIPLSSLLAAAGVPAGEDMKGPSLALVVLVSARDGYRAVFGAAEFDPNFTGRKAFVVDRCDGNDLDSEEGPLRLIVLGDKRGARSVRQVERIDVFPAVPPG
jgi:hypothetical protein